MFPTAAKTRIIARSTGDMMAIKLKPLKSQVVVITGATSPVGLAVARAAGRAGARLMLVDAGETALGEVVREINNAGGVSDYAVAGPHDAEALGIAGHRAAARFGRIDSWVLVPAGDEIDYDFRAGISVLRRAGGALIVVGATPAIIHKVELLRVEATRQAPLVAVVSVQPASPDTDPQRVAEAILRSAIRPQHDISVSDALAPLRLARSHPGIVAMIGLSGLALAGGAMAALRRRRAA